MMRVVLVFVLRPSFGVGFGLLVEVWFGLVMMVVDREVVGVENVDSEGGVVNGVLE
jgi:hypothetical protein